jgi:hypothetical protein
MRLSMRYIKVVPLVLIAVVFGVVPAQGQKTTAGSATNARVAHWQEDLKVLVSGLERPGYKVDLQHGLYTRGQKDFDKLYPKTTFDRGISDLEADLPRLSDDEVVLRLMRLIASAGVAHNKVAVPLDIGIYQRLPLTFHWYSDGLAVDASSADYGPARRARVLAIGNMTPEKLLAALAPYIPHENDSWLREMAADYLIRSEILRHFGLVNGEGYVSLTLEKPNRGTFEISVGLTDPRDQIPQIPFTGPAFAKVIGVPTPIFLSHPEEAYYWYQYLADQNAIYIQYRQCASDPGQPFAEFARRVLAEADAHPQSRVVIDMRSNGGGDDRIIGPLKRGLAARLKRLGPVYVLIGPGTFSSGVDNTIELRQDLKAKLVGEPTGGAPRAYGGIMPILLPNSKIVVWYSTNLEGPGLNIRTPSLEPDLLVRYSFEDARAGRDPLLEAALGKSPDATRNERHEAV